MQSELFQGFYDCVFNRLFTWFYLLAPDDSLVPEVEDTDVNKTDDGGNHEDGLKESEDHVAVNGDIAMEGEGNQTEHDENAEEGIIAALCCIQCRLPVKYLLGVRVCDTTVFWLPFPHSKVCCFTWKGTVLDHSGQIRLNNVDEVKLAVALCGTL